MMLASQNAQTAKHTDKVRGDPLILVYTNSFDAFDM